MAGKRKVHTAAFKAQVALAALQGGPDGQRAGRALRRPPDADPRLEEAAPRPGPRAIFGSPAQAGLG